MKLRPLSLSKVTRVPPGFVGLAATENAEHVAIGDAARRMWGLQFHPEVTHTPQGSAMIGSAAGG